MTKLVSKSQAPALHAGGLTDEQIDLVRRTIAKDATADELALFLHQCNRTGLDPLTKQIYFQKRHTKNGPQVTIITGIDGYRLIADRTGKYAGNDDPIFDDEKTPRKATVSVYKIVDGVRCPYTASARWEQYFPGESQGFMWKKMPHLMLGKCAEALALRKAFPAELSGVYVKEEMDQAGPPEPSTIYDGSPEEKKRLFSYLASRGVPEDQWEAIHASAVGTDKRQLANLVESFMIVPPLEVEKPKSLTERAKG